VLSDIIQGDGSHLQWTFNVYAVLLREMPLPAAKNLWRFGYRKLDEIQKIISRQTSFNPAHLTLRKQLQLS